MRGLHTASAQPPGQPSDATEKEDGEDNKKGDAEPDLGHVDASQNDWQLEVEAICKDIEDQLLRVSQKPVSFLHRLPIRLPQKEKTHFGTDRSSRPVWIPRDWETEKGTRQTEGLSTTPMEDGIELVNLSHPSEETPEDARSENRFGTPSENQLVITKHGHAEEDSPLLKASKGTKYSLLQPNFYVQAAYSRIK